MACHTRSNSFPSRPHPIIQEVDEHLCRLSSSEPTSTSSSTITHKLSGLKDLHECVDRLLQLQGTQQALAHQKCVNELLDGSLRLLDICSVAKVALLQTKECIKNIQSVIRRRRRRGEECEVVSSEIKKYLNSRKVVKKAIQKAMNLKGKTASSLNNDQDTIAIVSKLRDVEAVSFAIFESVLSFISGPKAKASSWSLVSKMVKTKRVACDEKADMNEFAEVDAALKSVKNGDNAQNQLCNLESCIQDQEEALESLFRHLIKTRVSLLNILSH